MTFRSLALAATALLLLPACDSDGIDSDANARVVYVGNAGNFLENNGSVTRYLIEDGTTSTPLTADSLGGLVQNLVPDGYNSLYVLLNFSDSFDTGRGRIDVLDTGSQRRTEQIEVSVPRDLADTQPTSAGFGEVWVSNLYANTVTNLVTGATLPTGANPEGVVAVGSRLYVANSGFGFGSSLTVIDTQTGTVLDPVEDLCAGPRSLARDSGGDVWVVCTGTSDFSTGEVTAPGEIVELDGATGAEKSRLTTEGMILGSRTLGQDLYYSVPSEKLFVIGDEIVYEIDTRADNPFEQILGSTATTGDIGAVAYDAIGERLYVAQPDAASPFGADGEVVVYDLFRQELARFPAGIAPVSVAVLREGPFIEG